MTDRIFTIENHQVVISPDILLIPWLKVIHDKYKEPIKALSYCKYMAEPRGIYTEFEEDVRKERIMQDFPGDYNSTDKEICIAVEKLKDSYMTTTIAYFEANKKMIQKLTAYLIATEIDDSKEGNLAHIRGLLKECKNTIRDFKAAEKEVEEELNTRGGKELAYDQI